MALREKVVRAGRRVLAQKPNMKKFEPENEPISKREQRKEPPPELSADSARASTSTVRASYSEITYSNRPANNRGSVFGRLIQKDQNKA